ncbi:unnamed protein product [Cercopithifilaria johnstoni]|uniref:Uncharacterized protein n=1 Tax=Cercopithifilaria johnstoni TaxID=2874296 RepID=A0A8J2PVU8_9BILA|nr:unnamed protein product [Cercopithifilaria johnstoni]
MWFGPPFPFPSFPPFCFPTKILMPASAPIAPTPASAASAPPSPGASVPQTSASPTASASQAPQSVIPPYQAKNWWCPSIYQQPPRVPQYPPFPQHFPFLYFPYPQYSHYPQDAQPLPQYLQQPNDSAGMVGSSLYGMFGEDSDLRFNGYDQFQMNFK